MKAKELSKEILKNPEFDIKFSVLESDESKWGIIVRKFKITGILDIGYSDKIIILDGEELK